MVNRKSCERHLFGGTDSNIAKSGIARRTAGVVAPVRTRASIRSIRNAAATILVSFGVAVIGAAALGCVNPRSDYDKFVVDTDPLRGRVGTDGGALEAAAPLPPIVGKAPTTPIEATYLLECLPGLAGGSPSKALKFNAKVSYTPSAAGGSIALTLHSILVGSTLITQTDPATSDIPLASESVAANGTFSGSLGTVNVPGTSNAISGGFITLEKAAVRGVIHDGDHICMQLDGNLTSPVKASINGTPCIAQRFDDATAPLPVHEDGSVFACPL